MPHTTRRSFLKVASVGALATIAGTKSSGRVLGANDTIRIAVAGLNGRGGSHVSAWSGMKDVQITYLIDPDTRTYAKQLRTLATKGGPAPKTIKDVREALEDKNLDAISIATPNHWHALMTIWACQAGKDVYVEKPASHNIHEGKIAVAMARKYNRIVQHGTQHRAEAQWANMAALAQSGKYGKLLVSRGIVYKDGSGKMTRGSIGIQAAKAPPAELDFNLWIGPAPEQPYHENLVPYRWHWFWDFGNGDIGNQGVHEMDKARWFIPGATLPRSVLSLGGRIGYKDQGQTASTQLAIFDYGPTKLIFEVRGLKSQFYPKANRGPDSANNVLHFEAGTVVDGKFYPKGKTESEPVAKVEYKMGPGGGRGEGGHFGNFITAVRSRKVEDLIADIQEGHRSAALIHLANASHRLGTEAPFGSGAVKAAINGDADAAEAWDRMEEYLAKENNIKLGEWPVTVGRKLVVDAGSESVVNDPQADKLLTRNYRAPFVVPEKV
jgi:predicted dehydrogenase